MVKNPPAMQEMWVGSLDQEDPLEKEMANDTVSSPGKSISWTEEPGWLQFMGCKELDTTERMNLNELFKKEHQSPFYLHFALFRRR